MPIITFETYKKAILKKFIDENNGEKSGGYLYNPTPSKIKNAVKHSLRDRGAVSEKLILADFFKISEQTDFINHLDTNDAEIFKSVQKFLTKKTKKPADNLVEFVAWMIDFQPRPYAKFQKTVEENIPDNDDANSIGKERFEITENVGELKKERSAKATKNKAATKTTVITYLGAVFVIGVLVTYIVWGPTNKKCMQWQDDHFIKIDCPPDSKSNLDTKLLQNFRKVSVDKNTAFFDKDRKPLIWYDKDHNQLEYFTSPGIHPKNGKTLKAITETIIRKYVLAPQ